jgi:hypothetical protein
MMGLSLVNARCASYGVYLDNPAGSATLYIGHAFRSVDRSCEIKFGAFSFLRGRGGCLLFRTGVPSPPPSIFGIIELE